MKELLFTEHPDNKIEIEKNGHKYRVEQHFIPFANTSIGSLYYFVDEELITIATISKPLNSDELTKELLKFIKNNSQIEFTVKFDNFENVTFEEFCEKFTKAYTKELLELIAEEIKKRCVEDKDGI